MLSQFSRRLLLLLALELLLPSNALFAQGNGQGLQPLQRGQLKQGIPSSPQPGLPVRIGNAAVEALPPFRLEPAEQQALERLLQDWEGAGQAIRNFKADFVLREYEAADLKNPMAIGKGYVSYQKPDKGEFNVREKQYRKGAQQGQDPNAKLWTDPMPGEHFVCTGTELIEVQHPLTPDGKGKVIIRPIPKEMQGKMIVFGPMPFVLGMQASELKARYSIRVVTKPHELEKVVELQVRPLWKQDAENFREAFVRLDKKALDPQAVKLEHPNGTATTYVFSNIQKPNVVNQLFQNMFKAPSVPRGYERVVEQPQDPQQAQAPPAPQPGQQNGAPSRGILPTRQAQQPKGTSGKQLK